MKESRKFDPKSLDKLNDPSRLVIQNPDLIWDTLALANPHVLVDIGAGTGFFSAPFARRLDKGRVYACDIEDEMLTWMKEHLPSDLQNKLIPLKMKETTVPLPDGIADLVFMINLHHELEDRRAMMREAYRILKKGGVLMIIDWKKEETPEGPPLLIRATEEDIISDMSRGGFTNIKTHRVLQYHTFVVGARP